MRIAVGGIQHETNTRAAITPLDAFILGGGWPGWQKGAQIAATLGAMNLPVSGAIAALSADARVGAANVLPLMWAAATPSGRVADAAFDALADELIERIEAAGPLDGVYLDLHGAMATVSHDDAEGELLARIRARVGDALPLVVSLDLHANVSRRSFELCDAMVVYRSYPHVDMDESGARAARLLIERIVRGRPWKKAMAEVAFVAPLTAQCTLAEPAQSLMARLERLEVEEGLASMSWASGFPLAEVSCRQQTVLVYGDDAKAAGRVSLAFAAAIEAERDRFTEAPLSAGDAVNEALRRVAAQAGLPVVLCDTEDNPGAGAASDNPGILRALVERAASRAVVAVLCDAQAASAAHAAGVGGRIELALGGRADAPDNTPYEAAFIVERTTDGRFTGTGPMWRDSPIDLGPMALLLVEHTDVRVIVSTRTMQAADQSIFRHVGIEPATMSVLALKSSVHFRADFNAITSSVIVVR
ncbi:M81 family metallopeptidase [Caballeronia sp. LZ034LL]|uniref:M81 family metallopeptidase n=1 Tax=Caballeronia sp. LZ034LL TaxID=3038567 RepID=UPI002855B9D4|nr:M81 family metallopeptidase [Caballeronia sp. LZ034LL]MDR5836257.1 M81 family metallopeptidase [Caballeronia sp. LZ034LL]